MNELKKKKRKAEGPSRSKGERERRSEYRTMKPLLPLLILLLLVAAFAASAERARDGPSSRQCNVLKRPAGVPGQAPITMCTNVTSLPAGND